MLKLLKKILIPAIAICLVAGYFIGATAQEIPPETTFTTIKGEKISMSSLRGKVVLVNFMASDCPSCNRELPDLVSTYNQYKNKGLVVISVAMSYDPPQQLLNYVSVKNLPFPVMHDGFGEMSKTFGNVHVTPTAFLFDKTGKRINQTVGMLDFAKLRATLDKELG